MGVQGDTRQNSDRHSLTQITRDGPHKNSSVHACCQEFGKSSAYCVIIHDKNVAPCPAAAEPLPLCIHCFFWSNDFSNCIFVSLSLWQNKNSRRAGTEHFSLTKLFWNGVFLRAGQSEFWATTTCFQATGALCVTRGEAHTEVVVEGARGAGPITS